MSATKHMWLGGAALLGIVVVLGFGPARPGAQLGTSPHVPANSSSGVTGISANGRYIVFTSWATNLVPGDTNRAPDAFVYDRVAKTIERVSVGAGGKQANARDASISADGRVVAFASDASSVVPGDTNAAADVFVRDRLVKTTERVSVGNGGVQANGESAVGKLSADGRFVTFSSTSSNLVPGDTNGVRDTFVRDRVSGTTERVSVGSSGAQANGDSGTGVISSDGRIVAFGSDASNLVAADTNGVHDAFVRDRVANTTERVDVRGVTSAGVNLWSMSADGRSIGVDLLNPSTGALSAVYIVGRTDGAAELVSVTSNGARIAEWSGAPAMSSDGRFVAFDTGHFVTREYEGVEFGDVFLRDRVKKTTERISVGAGGKGGNGASDSRGISVDGRYVAFDSNSSNLVAGDTNVCGDEGDQFNCYDVFVRDRVAHTTTLVSVGRPQPPPVGRLLLRPWPARAGRTLAATATVGDGTILVLKPKISCAAALAGRSIRSSGHSYWDATARCAWKIPASARGVQVKGSVTVATPSGSAVKRFAGIVG